MSAGRKERTPAGGPGFGMKHEHGGSRQSYRKHQAGAAARAGEGPRLPADWRNRLPEPAGYYSARVAKLGKPNGNGWAQELCPFHEDHDTSMSVNLGTGGWRCFAGCGHGDLVGFHIRTTGKPFKEAVAELIGRQA
ncbi:MAG: CHC2 zinc finger domain-containing protein [Pseudomonas sp.]